MGKESIHKIIETIDGWLSFDEGMALYDLAKNKRNQTIVEIGSWHGKSTLCLAEGAKISGSKIFAIDNHANPIRFLSASLPQFKNNLLRYNAYSVVSPLFATSLKASKKWSHPIDLVFIDGAHDYYSVKLDFLLWESHVVPGGKIIFHDAISEAFPDVKKVIDEITTNTKKFKIVAIVDSAIIIEKLSHTDSEEERASGSEVLPQTIRLYRKKKIQQLPFKIYETIRYGIGYTMGTVGNVLKLKTPSIYRFLKKIL